MILFHGTVNDNIMKTVSLAQLLSSCMDAGRQGCEVIQAFQQHQRASVPSTSTSSTPNPDAGTTAAPPWVVGSFGTLKEGGNPKSVVTQADIDAQAIIVGGLRRAWGDGLLIIGEEDGSDGPPTTIAGAPSLRKDLFMPDQQQQQQQQRSPFFLNTDIDDEDLPLDEITIFVDPLDGTREFVEGRLQNVACLIGIARNNRSIAGIIGVPFPYTSSDDGSAAVTDSVLAGGDGLVEIHYAVADQPGSRGVWLANNERGSDTAAPILPRDPLPCGGGVTILTGDSNNPVLVNATDCAKSIVASMHQDPRHLIVGGTAAKLRLVATTPDCISILHFKTELWDTCGPEALLLASGGKITDLFGAPLVHSPKRPFGNVFGVVASSGGSEQMTQIHDDLCQRMRADTESIHAVFGKWMGTEVLDSPQAIDIARDLDGLPYGVQSIEKLLESENPEGLSLSGYSVPEADAWRGMMSNGVRYKLNWERTDLKLPTNGKGGLPPSDVFLKRIVMSDLAHARDKLKSEPHKLVRDVRSYQVETSFLTSAAFEGLAIDTGLKFCKVLELDRRPVAASLGPKEQMESRFSIFLEYFQKSDGWEQQWLLDEEATKSSLAALAKMHAYFWKGSQFWEKDGGKTGECLGEIVWPNGGYMQPKLQGEDQFKQVQRGWEVRYPSFESDLRKISELDEVDLETLGKRLEVISPTTGRLAHPFFPEDETDGEMLKYRTLIHGDPKQANFFFRRNPDDNELEVGIIDFQWTGFGLAATDVAHHIASAVMPNCVSFDGLKEAKLLDHYHSCLCSGLVKFGVAASARDVEESIYSRAKLQEQYDVAFLDICRMVFAYAWRRWKPQSEPCPESFNRNAYNKSVDSVVWLITRCHILLKKLEEK